MNIITLKNSNQDVKKEQKVVRVDISYYVFHTVEVIVTPEMDAFSLFLRDSWLRGSTVCVTEHRTRSMAAGARRRAREKTHTQGMQHNEPKSAVCGWDRDTHVNEVGNCTPEMDLILLTERSRTLPGQNSNCASTNFRVPAMEKQAKATVRSTSMRVRRRSSLPLECAYLSIVRAFRPESVSIRLFSSNRILREQRETRWRQCTCGRRERRTVAVGQSRVSQSRQSEQTIHAATAAGARKLKQARAGHSAVHHNERIEFLEALGGWARDTHVNEVGNCTPEMDVILLFERSRTLPGQNINCACTKPSKQTVCCTSWRIRCRSSLPLE
jgi:hypothetical protein